MKKGVLKNPKFRLVNSILAQFILHYKMSKNLQSGGRMKTT